MYEFGILDFMIVFILGVVGFFVVFRLIIKHEQARLRRETLVSLALRPNILEGLRKILPNSRFIRVIDRADDVVVFKWDNHTYVIDTLGAIFEVKENWFKQTKFVVTNHSRSLQCIILAHHEDNVVYHEDLPNIGQYHES